LPVDFFFRSLAQEQHELSIGIILSGTGADGTIGLKDIKGASGMVMAQSEESARFAGMPRSALSTDMVDYVLPVEQLPEQLIAYVRGLQLEPAAEPPEHATPTSDEDYHRIFILLRNRCRHDFSGYKRTTTRRRIERRMNVHHVHEVAEYLRFLQDHPQELDALFRELLIGVTSFFRDPEAFHALGARVLPDLLASRAKGHVIRMWVAGCSTGEEA
jgi:two-component system CheB/CheR fusion protein